MAKCCLFLFSLVCLSISSFANGNKAYEELPEILPFNGQGWYSNAEPMEDLINKHQPKIVIELGSWLGLSTRHIAKCLPYDGHVFAVDHWLGSDEHQIETPEYLPTLYQQFLSNVIHEELTEKITPVKMTTLEAVDYFLKNEIVPDLIYVDASHDEKSVYADLKAYFPLVKGHGIICGDDWGWGPTLPIQKAVQRFARKNRLHVNVINGWFWILEER